MKKISKILTKDSPVTNPLSNSEHVPVGPRPMTPESEKAHERRTKEIRDEMIASLNERTRERPEVTEMKPPRPMSLPPLARRALEYWQDYLPEMYEELLESGELKAKLLEAEQKTQVALDSLENQFPDNQVPSKMREQVLQMHLFLVPLNPVEEDWDSQVHESNKETVRLEETLRQIEDEEAVIPTTS